MLGLRVEERRQTNGQHSRIADVKLFLLFFLSFIPVLAEPSCVLDGKTTQVIQTAIDACSAAGGGVVVVPAGEYTITTIWLKQNVELRLQPGATLLLDQDPSHWTSVGPGSKALIRARGVKNVALTGSGTVDGQARYVWAPVRSQDVEISKEFELAKKAGVETSRYYREGVQTYLLIFEDVENLRIEGVRLLNSPLWTIRVQDCNQVWVRGIYLYTSLEKGVNGDGIDLVSTSNVVISDSVIIAGDDAIVLKTSPFGRNSQKPVKPTENVVVTNCILSSSSTALMIGTETLADVRHVVFSNIVIRDSNKAFGINVQDGGTVSDVRFTNVTFELNRRHWNWWGSAEVMKFVLKKRTPESKLGKIENIVVDGVQGTARGTTLISGHAEQPLRDITISNVHVRMLPENRPDKRMTHGMVFERIEGLKLRNVEVEWAPDARPEGAESMVFREVKRGQDRD